MKVHFANAPKAIFCGARHGLTTMDPHKVTCRGCRRTKRFARINAIDRRMSAVLN